MKMKRVCAMICAGVLACSCTAVLPAAYAVYAVDSSYDLLQEYRGAETYAADCILNGSIDASSGEINNSVVLYRDAMNRVLNEETGFGYEVIADRVADNTLLVTVSEFWTLSTGIVESGPLALSDMSQQQLYELFLLDYLTYESEQPEYKSDLMTKSGEYTYKLYKAYSEYCQRKGKNVQSLPASFANLSDAERNDILADSEFFKSVGGLTEKLDKFIKVYKTGKMFWEQLSDTLALCQANQERIDFLNDIKAEASDNTSLCNAIDHLIEMHQHAEDAIVETAADFTVSEMMKTVWGTFTKAYPVFEVVSAASDGVDLVFNTNDEATNNIRILLMRTVGNYAKAVTMKSRTAYSTNRTDENAAAFNADFTAYLAYQEFASNWTVGYASDGLKEGWWNTVCSWFPNEKQETYDYWEARLGADANFCAHAQELIPKYKEIYNNLEERNSYGNRQTTIIGSENWLSECPPYDLFEEELYINDTEKQFTMGGISYSTGVSMTNRYEDDEYFRGVLFNLHGQYQSVSFLLGHVDYEQNYSGTFGIYVDGELFERIVVQPYDLPVEVSVPLNGAQHLRIKYEKGNGTIIWARYAIADGKWEKYTDFNAAAPPLTDWLKRCSGYQYTGAEEYREKTFKMGGDEYLGLVLRYPYNGQALFNLQNKYKSLSFEYGRVDYTTNSAMQIEIYLDGTLYDTLIPDGVGLPQSYTLELTGVRQLRFDYHIGNSNTLIGIGNGKWTSLVPDTGDFDDDGEIGADDAQMTLKAYVNILAEKDTGLTEAQKKAVDVDGDGEITATDAQIILKYYVNTLAGKDVTWEQLIPKKQ